MAPPFAFDAAALALVRRAFARQMLAMAGIAADSRLEEALAAVPRERFLGPPPWQVARAAGGYGELPSADPVLAYQDALFALAPGRGVNNGSPSLHAAWLHGLSPPEGGRVVHLGAGTGYYTALLAALVGERGRVTAVELDPALAALARANLAGRPNVEVVEGDGAGWPREPADGVYVNFSVPRPAEIWVEGLAPGGRLLFPLGVPRAGGDPRQGRHAAHGAALRIERRARGFAVDWLGPAYFVVAEGSLAGTAPERDALRAAFERGGVEFVRGLVWKAVAPVGRCWLQGTGWALGYDGPPPD